MKTLTFLILILFTLLPRSIGITQVTNGGTAVNQGNQMATCQNLSDVTNPVNGLTIYCYCDNLIHYYNNGWSKCMNSDSTNAIPRVTSVKDSSTDLNITGNNPITSTGTAILTLKNQNKTLYFGNYSTSGLIHRELDTIVTPNTAQGDSVNFSYIGFTQTPEVECIPQYYTTSAGAVPNVSIRAVSSTGVSFNIVNGNSAVVTLLSTVLPLGAATSFATVGSITLHIIAKGY
jgi:hypothetical protein